MRIIQIPEEFGHVLTGKHHLVFHSQYKRTINFTLDGRLISVQAFGTQPTPISICTDIAETVMDGIPESDATFTDGILAIGGHHLDTKGIQRYSSYPYCKIRSDFKTFRALEDTIYECEKYHSDKFGGNAIIKLVNDVLEQTEAACADAVIRKRYTDVADILGQLIGLGQGLTPSGDDYLIGVMAVLAHTDRVGVNDLKREISEMLIRESALTGDVSAAFLRCAAEDRFSRYVLEMMEQLSGKDTDKLTDAVNKVAETGHSSGIDLLKGVKWTCRVLRTGFGD